MPFFPPSGSGSLAPAGLPDYAIYADPAGSNSAAGTQGAPKQTIYAAVQAAIAAGGGTIYFNDNTTVGGPIPGQGIWLRNDGVTVPGFLNVNGKRLRFCPTGKRSGQFVFERPGAANFVGGAIFDYTLPAIWVVGTEVPVDFEFCRTYADQNTLQGIAAPARVGWDYVRDFTGEINWLDITNGNRADNSTVFTVDLDTAQEWTIVSASRTSNITTLTLTRPLTVAMSPWVPTAKIRVNTNSDPDFASGDYTVIEGNDILNLNPSYTTITVQYAETAADHADKSISGTVKSHGCAVGDYIAVNPTSNQFVYTPQMSVTAVTIDTITVFDPYGYGGTRNATTGNVADPGQLVKQLRGRQVASAVTFDRCSFLGYVGGATDAFFAAPALDLGGTSASDTRLYQCYFTGGNAWNWPDHPDNYDPSRTQVAILADPGSNTLSGASFQAYDCQSQSGHVRWNPHSTEAHIYIDQFLQDSASNALPTVVLGDALDFAQVYLHRIANADADQYVIDIGVGYDRLRVQIGDVYTANATPILAASGYLGPTNLKSAHYTTAGTPSPWASGNSTIWPGGLSTQHKGINWAFGTLSARLANQFPALAHWDEVGGPTAGITITQDGTAPDGSSMAFKVVNANGAITPFKIGAYPAGPWDTGDGVIFAAWIKFPSATGELIMTDYSGGTLFGGAGSLRLSRYVGSDGWQPVVLAARLNTTGPFAGEFFIQYNAPVGTSYVWLPTLIRSVAGALTDDEFFEYALNNKPQPIYLAAGMQGTPEGQKLIAHGGIGTSSSNSKTVGVGSGQLTLTGTGTVYLPTYAADGITIIGWVAQLQATINP